MCYTTYKEKEKVIKTENTYQVLIKRRIKQKFKTIENFSKHMNIPRTTLNFILKNGVGVSGFDTVNRILGELDISVVGDAPVVTDARSLEMLKKFDALDELGKHTVEAVARTEVNRIYHPDKTIPSIAAYEGMPPVTPLTDDEKAIIDLVKKIKETHD